MKKLTFHIRTVGALLLLLIFSTIAAGAAERLKVHGVFRSNMVLQREKPITIWGWAPAGKDVEVSLGAISGKGKATGENGRWEVVFAAQPANTNPQTITVKAGDEVVKMDNILNTKHGAKA